MGGRGSASGIKASGVFEKGAKERTIETIYRERSGWRGGYYKDEILEAVDNGNGEVSFVYATPEEKKKTAKTNMTQYLTYKLKAGSENGDVFGINWDNVKSVSGQTYNIKDEIKRQGFRWDGKEKKVGAEITAPIISSHPFPCVFFYHARQQLRHVVRAFIHARLPVLQGSHRDPVCPGKCRPA